MNRAASAGDPHLEIKTLFETEPRPWPGDYFLAAWGAAALCASLASFVVTLGLSGLLRAVLPSS